MPHPKISIRALQAFIAVYEEQSFSRAADRENATQSGMSTQVKNLELALGTPLLERGKGELRLTAAGQAIYTDGQRLLKDLFGLEEKVAGLAGAVTGRIRLGIIPGLTRAVLPRALTRYRAEFPHVEVSVLEEYSYSLMRRVAEDDLDCAAVPAGDLLGGLSATFLGRDEEVLVTRPGRLAGLAPLDPVTPGMLDGLGLILPSLRNVRRKWLEEYFDAQGVRPAERLEMDAMLATLESVATTDWCAVLPSLLVHPDRDGRVRSVHPLQNPGLTTDYVVVQKSERALSGAAEALVDYLKTEIAAIRGEWEATI